MTKKIKKQGFRTPYSESVLEGTSEHFYGASMTEPDNSMTIPQIIAKYTRGQGIPVRQNPWTVGEATEDGHQVGDGTDPEDFMNFGVSSPTVPEPPKPGQDQVPEVPPSQEGTDQAPDSTK